MADVFRIVHIVVVHFLGMGKRLLLKPAPYLSKG